MTAAEVVRMTGITKVYSNGQIEVEALRGIDLVIHEGEYVAIIGPSGSGKSTLMNIIGCLDVATGGEYLLDGDDVSVLNENRLAEIRNRRIGFVFQQFNLLASINAWRNVELPLGYAGVPASERKRRAMAALEQVGLSDRADHRPGELSGGQQQRVAVARALVTNPSLILADEPTGNLDSVSSGDMLDLLADLHGQGRTIVLITHDAEVASSAQRVVHVRDGHILSDEPNRHIRVPHGADSSRADAVFAGSAA
jgi:putative ABC transport system ATP-binding protein